MVFVASGQLRRRAPQQADKALQLGHAADVGDEETEVPYPDPLAVMLIRGPGQADDLHGPAAV